jgi:tetratricopeptide (TPR) repeat protein
VWVLLGQHEFARARDEALALVDFLPGDPLLLGLLVDANIEIGRYAEAERAAQELLDLGPGSVPALTRAAYLRELFGDLDGALDLMERAYRGLRVSDTEDRAWVLAQIGHLQLERGERDAAERALETALDTFPGYHYALAGLARLRASEGDHAAAAALYRARYDAAPHPECLFDLAVALREAGREAEALAAFARFESEALAEAGASDNANRELVRYYADQAGRPADALRIAEREVARRRDVNTLDAYAWALHAAGLHAEALRRIEAALAIGVRDAEIRYHAGVIAAAAGRSKRAAAHLRLVAASPFPRLRADATGRLRAVGEAP